MVSGIPPCSSFLWSPLRPSFVIEDRGAARAHHLEQTHNAMAHTDSHLHGDENGEWALRPLLYNTRIGRLVSSPSLFLLLLLEEQEY